MSEPSGNPFESWSTQDQKPPKVRVGKAVIGKPITLPLLAPKPSTWQRIKDALTWSKKLG